MGLALMIKWICVLCPSCTDRRGKVARLCFVTLRLESKQCCLACIFLQVQISLSRSFPVLQPTEYCAEYKTTIFEPINIFGKVWQRVENWAWKLLLAGQWTCPNSAFICFQKVPTKTSLMCCTRFCASHQFSWCFVESSSIDENMIFGYW